MKSTKRCALLIVWLAYCLAGWAALAHAVAGHSSSSGVVAVPSAHDTNKDITLAFYQAALNDKDFAKASRYLGSTYKQHNPHAQDGVTGFRQFIENLKAARPDSHSEVVRAFSDGDYVILHVHKTQTPDDRGQAIIDIFRLQQGKIVEHWDVTQDVPEHTVSGNTMF